MINRFNKIYFMILGGILGAGLLVFLLKILLSPNYYKEGILNLKQHKYDLALEAFKKINMGADNYYNALQGQYLVYALKSYELKDYRSVLMYLGKTSWQSDFAIIVDTLKRVTQDQLDLDSVKTLSSQLTTLISNNGNYYKIAELLRIIGRSDSFRNKFKTIYPNSEPILVLSRRIIDLDNQSSLFFDRENAKVAELESSLNKQKSNLDYVKSEGIQWQTFSIGKLFDKEYDNDANESKEVYSAIDRSGLFIAVVIASENQIPNNTFERFSVSLLVKPLGNRSYTETNRYGNQAEVFLPTFITVESILDPILIIADIERLEKEIHESKKSITEHKRYDESEAVEFVSIAMKQLRDLVEKK